MNTHFYQSVIYTINGVSEENDCKILLKELNKFNSSDLLKSKLNNVSKRKF